VGSGASRQESGVRSQWTFYLFSQLRRSLLPKSNQYCQQGNYRYYRWWATRSSVSHSHRYEWMLSP